MMERDLKMLLEEQAVRSVCVRPLADAGTTTYSEGSYMVLINDKPLMSQRHEVRRFARFDTVIKFMRGVGVTDFSVSLRAFS